MNRFKLYSLQWAMALVVHVGFTGPLGGMEPLVAESQQAIGVGVIGSLSGAQIERIRSFVEKNTALRILLLDDVPDSPREELADWLEILRDATPGASFDIYMYAGDQVFDPHSVYSYRDQQAVVNATALCDGDEELFLRRMEKLVMRAVGLLLDVPMVPNPQSAMWAYQTIEELDFMGRNFDPPSLLRLQENARERGLPLEPDSPFLLLFNE